MLEDARSYLERGISILPLRRDSKKPLGRWKRFQENPLTPDDARAWWGVFQPPPGIGVVTGQVSRGLVVLDIEPEHVNDVLSAVELPEGAAVARTARGGLHVYCRGERRSGHLRVQGEHVGDIRGDGGYVVAPPTRTSAGLYGWEAALEAPEELPEVPVWAEGGQGFAPPPPVLSRSQSPAAAAGSLTARLPTFVQAALWRPSVRYTPSELDYYVCLYAVRVGLSFGEVCALFESSPIGANLERHGSGYLEQTYGAAWMEFERERAGAQDPQDATRTARVKCVRAVVSHSNWRSRQRASFAFWDRARRTVYNYTIPIVLQDGSIAPEWRRAAEALGIDPDADSPVRAEGRRCWAVVGRVRGDVRWFLSS